MAGGGKEYHPPRALMFRYLVPCDLSPNHQILRGRSMVRNKERNKRIFKDEKNPPHRLFELTFKQLKETVGSTVNDHPKNPPSEADLRILRQMGMHELIP